MNCNTILTWKEMKEKYTHEELLANIISTKKMLYKDYKALEAWRSGKRKRKPDPLAIMVGRCMLRDYEKAAGVPLTFPQDDDNNK